MKEQALGYEQASGWFLRRYGINPFHPDGWEEVGLDPHGAAGIASLQVDRAFLFFATPLSKERVKAAVHRLAKQAGFTVDIDVVGRTLLLELGGLTCLLSEELALFVAARPDAAVDVRALAMMPVEDSLAESAGLRAALEHTGRGGAGLLVGDLAGVGATVTRNGDAEGLFSRDAAPVVAALDTTEIGIGVRWAAPLARDSALREVFRDRERSGVALRAKEVPLQALEASVDLRGLAKGLRGSLLQRMVGGPGVVELVEDAARASDGELSFVVHREIIDRVGTALWRGQPLPEDVPATAEVAVDDPGAARRVLDRVATNPAFDGTMERREGGYELGVGQLRGQLAIQPDRLRFRSGEAPELAARDVSGSWRHPHAAHLSRLLDPKGTAFTLVVDSALLDLMLVPLPGSYRRFALPDSPAATSAAFVRDEAALAAPAERAPDDPRVIEEARRRRLEERMKTDAVYQEKLEALQRTSEELERHRTGQLLELARRRFRADRPGVLGVLRGELDDVGLVGEGALVVNTATLEQWLPAFLEELNAPNVRSREDYERDQELQRRLFDAEREVHEEAERIEGELADEEEKR